MFHINFDQPIHVHFIGIGGISMSGLAEILLLRGFTVTGSDSQASPVVNHLERLGAAVQIGQRASNITPEIDLIVYTAAIKPDNSELAEAIYKQIPTLSRADLLGQIMDNYDCSIAVSGTHGKTTTTSMLSHIFLAADKDPTITVGGILDAIDGNIRVGNSSYFITEACEYTNSFLSFSPNVSIILNIEEDHLDFFSDLEEIISSFRAFAEKLSANDLLVINRDDPHADRIMSDLPCSIATFGFSTDSKYRATDISFDDTGKASFLLVVDENPITRIELQVSGNHNISNALSAIAVAMELGFDINWVTSGLSSYPGTKRRFEYKGRVGEVSVYDDYAHHPTEIQATLQVASHIPHEKLWCVFQPHTYTRTKSFLKDFAKAFRTCDHVILTDIFAAREPNDGSVHSLNLLYELRKYNVSCNYFSSFDEVETFLLKNFKKNDMLITIGAGDVYLIGNKLLGH